MRGKEIFSRFNHSFLLCRAYHCFKVSFLSMRPGFHFDKDEGVTIKSNYINFTAACPPVPGYYFPVFCGKIRCSLFFTGITGLFG